MDSKETKADLKLEELEQANGGDATPELQGDITTGIVNFYKNSAEQFDLAVNKMTADASTPNTGAGTVSTAKLTTDGMVVQAKQSIRDSIGGAASTVFNTIKKLAQQLGQ
ncbi:MAG: hypothetical protein WCV63_09610 [Negativicutes bacterium]|jgi:hypothetical protein